MFKRNHSGGNMVEYVIPLAVLALVVGFGIYTLSSTGLVEALFLSSSKGNYNLGTGKLALNKDKLDEQGIFKDRKGKIVLRSQNGKEIILPQTFYENYKNDLFDYQAQNKFEFAETSGTAGVEDITNENNVSTKLYARLFEIAAKNNKDETAKELLENMKNMGFEVGDIEEKMVDIQLQFDDAKKNFLAKEEAYKKQVANFESQIKATNDVNAADEMYKDITSLYNTYKSEVSNFNALCKNLYTVVSGYNTQLKTDIGPSFDESVNKVKVSAAIDTGTKDIVVPIARKIQGVKNTVDVVSQDIATNTINFDDVKSDLKDIKTVFKDFKMQYDPDAFNECLQKWVPDWCK